MLVGEEAGRSAGSGNSYAGLRRVRLRLRIAPSLFQGAAGADDRPDRGVAARWEASIGDRFVPEIDIEFAVRQPKSPRVFRPHVGRDGFDPVGGSCGVRREDIGGDAMLPVRKKAGELVPPSPFMEPGAGELGRFFRFPGCRFVPGWGSGLEWGTKNRRDRPSLRT